MVFSLKTISLQYYICAQSKVSLTDTTYSIVHSFPLLLMLMSTFLSLTWVQHRRNTLLLKSQIRRLILSSGPFWKWSFMLIIPCKKVPAFIFILILACVKQATYSQSVRALSSAVYLRVHFATTQPWTFLWVFMYFSLYCSLIRSSFLMTEQGVLLLTF